MQSNVALRRITSLAVQVRERDERILASAQAPVFRVAVQAQLSEDLEQLRALYRRTRSTSWERAMRDLMTRSPLVERGPGVDPASQQMSISESLHDADLAAGFDDLSVAVPEVDEDTPMDKRMSEWGPETSAFQKLSDVLRMRQWHPVVWSERRQRGRCSIPVSRGRELLREFWVEVGRDGREWFNYRTEEIGPTVITSSEITAYVDDAMWAARREDVPERLVEMGPEADMKRGPRVWDGWGLPVTGPDMLPEETDPQRAANLDPGLTERMDLLWECRVTDQTLLAQPVEDVVLSHDTAWVPVMRDQRPITFTRIAPPAPRVSRGPVVVTDRPLPTAPVEVGEQRRRAWQRNAAEWRQRCLAAG